MGLAASLELGLPETGAATEDDVEVALAEFKAGPLETTVGVPVTGAET